MVAGASKGGRAVSDVVLTFQITFHARFRVGAAYPLDGLDVAVDVRDPLPADHLKGLMRAEACRLLDVDVTHLLKDGSEHAALIRDVFGTPRMSSPWTWAKPVPHPRWEAPTLRHRVEIDDQTLAASRDQLVMASSTYATTAMFTVSTPFAKSLGSEEVERHAALLRLAGRSVHYVGAWRRRGLGSVGVTIPDVRGPGGESATWETDWARVLPDTRVISGGES